MKLLKNNEGIALVTALMLTMISLTIVMAVMYMVTQSIHQSGQLRKYRTALDASYGGSEIVVKDILPVVLQNYSSTTFAVTVQGAFSDVGLQVFNQNCMQNKLTKNTSLWPASCGDISSEPKKSPDMSFTLQAASGNPFIVYSKIVSTVVGNSDTGGLQLEGSGVAESSSLLTPQHFPYIYTMDVQGERQNNPTTKANIEILYAY